MSFCVATMPSWGNRLCDIVGGGLREVLRNWWNSLWGRGSGGPRLLHAFVIEIWGKW
jgi:hypothetical protein